MKRTVSAQSGVYYSFRVNTAIHCWTTRIWWKKWKQQTSSLETPFTRVQRWWQPNSPFRMLLWLWAGYPDFPCSPTESTIHLPMSRIYFQDSLEINLVSCRGYKILSTGLYILLCFIPWSAHFSKKSKWGTTSHQTKVSKRHWDEWTWSLDKWISRSTFHDLCFQVSILIFKSKPYPQSKSFTVSW